MGWQPSPRRGSASCFRSAPRSAIVAFLIGLFGTRPNAKRLLGLGIAAAPGGPPPPDILQEIATVQDRLKLLARIAFAFIVVAVVAMATARYW